MKIKSERAIELYQKEQRFRMLVLSAVGRAMQDYGEIDPDRNRQAAAEIAAHACAMLLETIYREDAEIAALREQLDQMTKVAQNALRLVPPRIIVNAEDLQ